MADDTSGANKYVGNSNRDKIPQETPERKVEKVIEGGAVQRKKPLGRRIAENFTGADAQSVGQYVLFEVVLPQLKDLVFDVGSSALQRALFGDRGGKTYSPGNRRGAMSYNTISTQKAGGTSPYNSKPVQQSLPSNDFGEIIVETRAAAEEARDKMSNLIETYSMASVADLKAVVGLTASFTDEKFGWTTMGGTDVRRVGGAQPGYLLIFPQPMELQ